MSGVEIIIKQEMPHLTAIAVKHENLEDAIADIQTDRCLSIYQLLDRPGYTTVVVATDSRTSSYAGWEEDRLARWNMKVSNDE